MRIWKSILLISLFASPLQLHATTVGLVQVKGAIGPATASYIDRALNLATARGDSCLILQLDTPGGLLDSTKEIVQKFYDAKIPILVYVAPAPACAGSAGVFITMTADIAAMAPHTSIGAAHPVSIGLGGEAEKTDEVMKKKQENFTASFAESIAEKRHRNAVWARAAVVESAAITAEEALSRKVIDLIAKDLTDLLQQINDLEINGRKLHTADAQVVEIPMTGRESFLQLVLRPEAMFILMLVVIYGIIGELSSPGAVLPGVAGTIALLLVLYMSAILPVNIIGVAFLALAVALFVIDIYAPTHGVLTFGGVAAFFFGALMLFNRADPEFRLSLWYILPATGLTALFFVFVVAAGLQAQFLPVRSGRETMLGKVTPAQSPIDSSGGRVFVEGESWRAVSEVEVAANQPVEILAVEGLTLKVKPKKT